MMTPGQHKDPEGEVLLDQDGLAYLKISRVEAVTPVEEATSTKKKEFLSP